MNYTGYIEYNGENLPFRLAFSTIKKFKLDTGIDIEELESHFEYLDILLYFALMEGHKKMNKDFNYSKDDVTEIVNDNLYEVQEKISEALSQTEEIANQNQEKQNSNSNNTSNKKK